MIHVNFKIISIIRTYTDTGTFDKYYHLFYYLHFSGIFEKKSWLFLPISHVFYPIFTKKLQKHLQ